MSDKKESPPSVQMAFRITPQQKAQITKRAEKERRTPSDWVRLAVLDALGKKR